MSAKALNLACAASAAALILVAACLAVEVVDLDPQAGNTFLESCTVTNWNGEKVWLAPGAKFRPKTPAKVAPPEVPEPVVVSRSTLVQTVANPAPRPFVRSVTPQYQNVVVFNDKMQPIPNLGWIQDTNTESPNYILVLEGQQPADAKFFGSQK